MTGGHCGWLASGVTSSDGEVWSPTERMASAFTGYCVARLANGPFP